MNKVSKTEDRLYEAMLSIGLRPERQYLISRMKVDFAFPKECLVIEVDGPYKRNSVGMKTLFERKRVCEKEGWKVENFTAEEVFEDADKVARRIYHMVKDEERKNRKIDNWGVKKYPKGNIKSSRIISTEREDELKKIIGEDKNNKQKKMQNEKIGNFSLRKIYKSIIDTYHSIFLTGGYLIKVLFLGLIFLIHELLFIGLISLIGLILIKTFSFLWTTNLLKIIYISLIFFSIYLIIKILHKGYDCYREKLIKIENILREYLYKIKSVNYQNL